MRAVNLGVVDDSVPLAALFRCPDPDLQGYVDTDRVGVFHPAPVASPLERVLAPYREILSP